MKHGLAKVYVYLSREGEPQDQVDTDERPQERRRQPATVANG